MTARRYAVFDEPLLVTLYDDPEDPDGLDLAAGFRAACAAAGWYGPAPAPAEIAPAEEIRHNRWLATQGRAQA